MRLELGTFPVKDVVFGRRTRYQKGVLEVDREGLLQAMLKDSRLVSAEMHLARPGESARITKVRDALEPRIKVKGPGMVYPGVCGRPVTTVGTGRTHRLSGVSVMELSAMPMYDGYDSPVEDFVDMSGPGAALTPFGATLNICLKLEPDPKLSILDQNEATHSAALLVSDMLAGTVADQKPESEEVFELRPADPSLPRTVYIICLRSSEHYSGQLYAFFTSIYGLTRLTPPWLLHPNELLDGAISVGAPYYGPQATSWVYVNNPIVLELYRRHGVDLAFAGVINIRTRWTAQSEKDITSQQAAKLAQMVGAQGAVISWDAGGNDFMETIRTVQACEKLGIKTVFVTGEEPPESGGPPLLEPLPEATAIVSTGMGHLTVDRQPLPVMERLIGYETIAADIMLPKEQISAKGPFTHFRGRDIYGFGRVSGFAY